MFFFLQNFIKPIKWTGTSEKDGITEILVDGFHPRRMRCSEVHEKGKLLLKSIKWTNTSVKEEMVKILMTVHPRRVKMSVQQMDGSITKSNKMNSSPIEGEMF